MQYDCHHNLRRVRLLKFKFCSLIAHRLTLVV